MKKHSIKVALVQIPRKELWDYRGLEVFRLAGRVRILQLGAQVRYAFSTYPDVVITNNGSGFFKPIAYIVNRIWDEDDRFKPIRVSEYSLFEKYLPRNENDEFIPFFTTNNRYETTGILIDGFIQKTNPRCPYSKDIIDWSTNPNNFI